MESCVYRDPADKLIRHRACSLRDNAYALIKAELDSDFEDKCREISSNRKSQNSNSGGGIVNKKKNSPKAEACQGADKSDRRDSSLGGAIVLNGKRLPSSRKRRIPAWARGQVRKIHKKKKISLEDSVHQESSPGKQQQQAPTSERSGQQGIDLDKFQEFESEAHGVLNGHLPMFEHTDSDNDSQNDSVQQHQQHNTIEQLADKRLTADKKNQSEPESMEMVGLGEQENRGSHASSSRESLNAEELSFALDSDSSLSNAPEESDKLQLDRAELEGIFAHTVKATAGFPIELLCDVYVQLSRRVGQYARTYDRKSLPKVGGLFFARAFSSTWLVVCVNLCSFSSLYAFCRSC